MNLIAPSAFTDNYIWMFHDGTQAVVARRAGTGGHSSEAQPGNAEIANYSRWCEAPRKSALPTLPSSIDRERRVDPFLRCDEIWVAQAACSHGAASDEPVAVLTALRQWKNDFR